MHQLGIKGTHRRRYRKTTERDASLAVAPDLMNRDFSANKPDEKYVGDIAYMRSWEGWLYLAIILDVFSRRIVGWAMGTTLHTGLVVQAFEMAVRHRSLRSGLPVHQPYLRSAHPRGGPGPVHRQSWRLLR